MTARGLRIVQDESSALDPGAIASQLSPAPTYRQRRAVMGGSPIPAQRRGDDVETGGIVPGSSAGQGCAAAIAPAAVGTLVSVAPLMRWAATVEDRTWTTRAICAMGDPDRLFVTGAAQREAAKLCRGCPVQMECLADALDNQIEFGVWGGLTERQRRALLKRRPDVQSWRAVLEQARAGAVKPVAS